MIKSKLNSFRNKFLKVSIENQNSQTFAENTKVMDNDFSYAEQHNVDKIGLLRAGILGANDGLISVSSLIIGIASTPFATKNEIIIAGIAGLCAGAMSMAAGEYISVSSQSDAEKADIEREMRELEENPTFELKELAKIYENRGLDKELAMKVAEQLTAKNALAAHIRDELGITDSTSAKPIQAAVISFITFSIGAILPLLIAIFFPIKTLIISVSLSSLLFLGLLGFLGAKFGGANIYKAIKRVTFWGAFAMLFTALIGKLFGVVL
jgi:VIT1/CCC1 family predicted Fe2+/Mn2+ transporter